MPKSIDQLLSVANEYYIYTCGVDRQQQKDGKESFACIYSPRFHLCDVRLPLSWFSCIHG